MAQLVDLVIPDGLHLHLLENEPDVVLARGQHGETRAREGDFAGGAELVDHILTAILAAGVKDIQQLLVAHAVAVHEIGIIPENAEIVGCGLERGKGAHNLVGVGDAAGVGILWHAPDALDRGVLLDIPAHEIHIRAVFVERDIDHLDTEGLADGKVAVVAGHGAEEFQLALLPPGLAAAIDAQQQRAHDRIIHQIQAGLPAHDDVIHLQSEQIGKELLALVHTGELAVVAHVGALSGDDQLGRFKPQHIHRQIELGRVRLAAGHVKLLILGLQGGIFRAGGLQLLAHCVLRQARILSHRTTSENQDTICSIIGYSKKRKRSKATKIPRQKPRDTAFFQNGSDYKSANSSSR